MLFEMNQNEWMTFHFACIQQWRYILDHVFVFVQDKFEKHNRQHDSNVRPKMLRIKKRWSIVTKQEMIELNLWLQENHDKAIDVLFHHDKCRQNLFHDVDPAHKTKLFQLFDQQSNPEKIHVKRHWKENVDQFTLFVSSTTRSASPEICKTAFICFPLC